MTMENNSGIHDNIETVIKNTVYLKKIIIANVIRLPIQIDRFQRKKKCK